MSGERPNRVSDLYHEALRRPSEKRRAILRDACGSDTALGDEVESLLRHEASVFLEQPAAVAVAGLAGASSSASPLVNHQIGPYTIIGLLGTGGMGDVYRARDSKLGRDVAIKILPRHFAGDPERRARFEREARVLATLSHPHIGTIFGLEEADRRRARRCSPEGHRSSRSETGQHHPARDR